MYGHYAHQLRKVAIELPGLAVIATDLKMPPLAWVLTTTNYLIIFQAILILGSVKIGK